MPQGRKDVSRQGDMAHLAKTGFESALLLNARPVTINVSPKAWL